MTPEQLKISQQEKRLEIIAVASRVLLGVNLLSVTIFILSVLATRDRLITFFDSVGIYMPKMTKLFLSISPSEYMFIFFAAGMMFIMKERIGSKAVTLALNVIILLLMVTCQFLYVVALASALNP